MTLRPTAPRRHCPAAVSQTIVGPNRGYTSSAPPAMAQNFSAEPIGTDYGRAVGREVRHRLRARVVTAYAKTQAGPIDIERGERPEHGYATVSVEPADTCRAAVGYVSVVRHRRVNRPEHRHAVVHEGHADAELSVARHELLRPVEGIDEPRLAYGSAARGGPLTGALLGDHRAVGHEVGEACLEDGVTG